MGSQNLERPGCSQICPGCHILPAKHGTGNFNVTCDHAIDPADEFVGTLPPVEESGDADVGMLIYLACIVPAKRLQPV